MVNFTVRYGGAVAFYPNTNRSSIAIELSCVLKLMIIRWFMCVFNNLVSNGDMFKFVTAYNECQDD